MDRDELRSAIGNILSEPWGIDLEDKILVLLAPEIEKAEKWDRVAFLVEGDCSSCNALNYCEKNDVHPCEILKDVLSKEAT